MLCSHCVRTGPAREARRSEGCSGPARRGRTATAWGPGLQEACRPDPRDREPGPRCGVPSLRRGSMNHSARIGLLGMAAFAAAGLVSAYGGTGYSADVLVNGSPVPEYASRGRVYVEALKGKEFTIRLSNPTAGR